jgi:1-acyl-sn-glycerol-3-phosphate acyltransferase
MLPALICRLVTVWVQMRTQVRLRTQADLHLHVRQRRMRCDALRAARLGHGGPVGDLFAAAGAVVGAPETARELMHHDEPILVFPGGGREIPKFKGEENTLRWQGRAGFARLAVENDYPIVPVGLVGGGDVYRSLVTRKSWWGRLSQGVTEKLSGRSDTALPLMHGIGPTLIPRPQRMYLRFATPIDSAKPARVANDKWVATVKQKTQESLEQTLGELVDLRSSDPYRELNPWPGTAPASHRPGGVISRHRLRDGRLPKA